MAHHTLDLGQLDLVSTTSGLALQLASSVQIVSGEESGYLQSLVEGGEHGICSTLAADFHVEIELLNLPEHITSGQLDIQEQLARELTEAPFWKQLQLRPSATESTLQGPDSDASLRMYINYATHSTDSATRKTHNIAQDVPHHDVEPPHGIGRAELRAVRLQMSFCDTRAFKRRKLPGVSRDRLQESSIKGEDVANPSTNVDIMAGHDSSNMTKSRRARTTPERAMSSAQSERLESMITSLASNGHSGPSLLIQSLKRSSSTSDIDAGSSIRGELDTKDLFNAGLHYAIATPPRYLLKAIAVTGRGSFKQLAYIWPTIFSPGCMEALSSRAVLLPTITHALTGICGARSRSATLRSKFAELDRRHVTQLSRGTRTATLQDRLSCRLWQTTQYHLVNRARILRLGEIMKVGSASASTLFESPHATAQLQAGSTNSSEYSKDHVADARLYDEHVSRLGDPNGSRTDHSTAGSSSEDPRDGHAVDTSLGQEARDSRMLDVEDDLSSICGSVDSLCLEDRGHFTLPSGECPASVSSTWDDLFAEGEETII